MDPTATAALAGAALGAATQSFVEDLYQGAKGWLLELMGKHQPKAADEAIRRVETLFYLLAQRVQDLDNSHQITASNLSLALEDPGFNLLYQSAARGAAETSDPTKHDMLARLVAARLTEDSESYKSVVLPMAVAAVPRLRSPHFAILALHSALRFGAPQFSNALSAEEEFNSVCNDRLESMINSFTSVKVTAHDLGHLESVGCGVTPPLVPAGKEGMWEWTVGRFSLDDTKIRKLPVLKRAESNWPGLMIIFRPTPCGALVGLAAIEAAGCDVVGTKDWRDWYPTR